MPSCRFYHALAQLKWKHIRFFAVLYSHLTHGSVNFIRVISPELSENGDHKISPSQNAFLLQQCQCIKNVSLSIFFKTSIDRIKGTHKPNLKMGAESVPPTRDVTIKVDYCAILLTSLNPSE